MNPTSFENKYGLKLPSKYDMYIPHIMFISQVMADNNWLLTPNVAKIIRNGSKNLPVLPDVVPPHTYGDDDDPLVPSLLFNVSRMDLLRSIMLIDPQLFSVLVRMDLDYFLVRTFLGEVGYQGILQALLVNDYLPLVNSGTYRKVGMETLAIGCLYELQADVDGKISAGESRQLVSIVTDLFAFFSDPRDDIKDKVSEWNTLSDGNKRVSLYRVSGALQNGVAIRYKNDEYEIYLVQTDGEDFKVLSKEKIDEYLLVSGLVLNAE